MIRALPAASGVLLALACLVELPLVLSLGALVLALGTGPSSTLLSRTSLTRPQRHCLGFCGDLALLLLGVQLMLWLGVWFPTFLILTYAVGVATAPLVFSGRGTFRTGRT